MTTLDSPTTLSVVVPAYRSSSVGEAVASVAPLRPERVVVVDSSPDEPPPLDGVVRRLWSPDRMNPAEARNHGAESLRSDFLLFLDSDVVLTEEARRFIGEFLGSPDRDLVSGVYRTDRTRNGVLDEFQNAVLRYRLLGRSGGGTRHGSTSHLLVRREVFEGVGGFNPELETDEDMEFIARCLRFGHPLAVEPRFEAIHLKRFTLGSLMTDNLRKAFDAFMARRRYPGVYRGFDLNLGPILWTTLFAGCLLPLLVILGLIGLAPGRAIGAGVLLTAAAPLLLWPSVLRETSWLVRSAAFVVWPVTAIVVAIANVAAVFRWAGGRLTAHLRGFVDLSRSGWRVLRRSGMPVQIVHFVTARCNLRCEHCFYKESLDDPNPGEISIETLDSTVRGIGPVLWYSLAGGEPYLRGDLVEVLSTIRSRCRPRVLSVPTNGWYVERTFRTTLRTLQRLDGGNLIVFLSLDGPAEVHDEIRGDGSFERAKACMERLRPLQDLFSNLYLNVITTVMPQNASVAPAFIDEIVRDFRPNSISINLFRYHSLEHPPIPEEVLDSYDESMRVYAGHLERGTLAHYGFVGRRVLAAKEVLKGRVISLIAREDAYVTPCTAGTLSYVIKEDGSVGACEILKPSQDIGSLGGTQRSGSPLQVDGAPEPGSAPVPVSIVSTRAVADRRAGGDGEPTFAELVRSDEAKRLRTWIRDTECHCTYECAMTTNTLFSWPLAGRLYGGVARSIVRAGGRS